MSKTIRFESISIRAVVEFSDTESGELSWVVKHPDRQFSGCGTPEKASDDVFACLEKETRERDIMFEV